jgi:hypothetical protein
VLRLQDVNSEHLRDVIDNGPDKNQAAIAP